MLNKEQLQERAQLARIYEANCQIEHPTAQELAFRPSVSPNRKSKIKNQKSWYLVSAELGPGRVLLERTEPWKVTPEMISLSPLLKRESTIKIP